MRARGWNSLEVDSRSGSLTRKARTSTVLSPRVIRSPGLTLKSETNFGLARMPQTPSRLASASATPGDPGASPIAPTSGKAWSIPRTSTCRMMSPSRPIMSTPAVCEILPGIARLAIHASSSGVASRCERLSAASPPRSMCDWLVSPALNAVVTDPEAAIAHAPSARQAR